MKDISRRDFIKFCGLGTLGFLIKPAISCAKSLNDDPLRSDVVQCFHENANTGSTINEPIVQLMMDESIKTLTGIPDVGEAWRSVFPGITENSVITIKVNGINDSLPTHPEFANCIVNSLAQMQFGIRHFTRNNIIIWDRTDWELVDADYTIYDGNDPDTARCFGTDHSGIGYDYSTPFDVDGVTSYPSRILTEMTDFLINAAVLKDHNGATVTLTMKNHYGSVNNPGSLHNGASYTCNPDIPALNQQIRDVVTPNNIQKIFIIDGIFGKVNWGPNGPPNCNPKKLIMSFDQVACDSQGQNLINEERLLMGYGTISAPHIQTAASPPYNLGSTAVELIEINNPTAISEFKTRTPERYSLHVAPNPIRTRTTISFSLPEPSAVHIDLINATGRLEDRIFAGALSQGKHNIRYEIKKRVTSGSYFLRLHDSSGNTLRKVTILN
jgi:hypothetical protein